MAQGDAAVLAVERKNAEHRASGERVGLLTGFCLAGWHEGTRPKTRTGEPVKTCPLFLDCPCKCHIDLDELFALSERPRELVTNPDYQPVITHNVIRPTVTAPSILSGDTVQAGVIVSPAPGIVPGEKVKEFSDTKSGRIQRGQLEYWTKAAIDVWVIEYGTQPEGRRPACTPTWICEQISLAEGIAPPLTGGVNHIFRRWEELGIATFGGKPTRFCAYTQEAIELGIDRMRDRVKSGLAF